MIDLGIHSQFFRFLFRRLTFFFWIFFSNGLKHVLNYQIYHSYDRYPLYIYLKIGMQNEMAKCRKHMHTQM